MTIDEIKAELEALLEKLNSDEDLTDEEVKSIEEKAEQLEKEKRNLIEKGEKRAQVLEKLKRGVDETIKEAIPEERKLKMEKEENIYATAEYRTAFLKKLQGKSLDEKEARAMTSAENSAGAAIPTETENKILERLYEEADLLNEIELLHVNSNVTFAVEATPTDANIHAEGATINEDGDVLIPVSLSIYEVTKYITISKTVKNMAVDKFEDWLVRMIAKRVARKLVKLIINGTGTNQAKGVNAITYTNANSVTVARTAALTKENVLALISKLPGGYHKNAKFLMSMNTLLSDFRPLQNKGADDFYSKENGKYYIEGYEVLIDESVTAHEAIFGDFKMYAGNMSDEISVDTDKKLSSNVYEYLGSTAFDGKPAIDEAFVKLAKATS